MSQEIENFAKELSTRYELDEREESSIVRCLVQEAAAPNPKTFRTPKGPSNNRVHRVCGALAQERRKKGLKLPLNRLREEVNRFLHSLRTDTQAG